MESTAAKTRTDRPSWWSRIEVTCPKEFAEAESFAKATGRHEQLTSLLGQLAMSDTPDESLTYFGRPIEGSR